MHILILIAAVWGGFFLLSLALAAAHNRSRSGATQTATVVDFRVHPLLLPGDVEQLKPLRDIITSKLTPQTNPNAKKETIFVVDDDPDILNLIKHVLELEGFEVVPFGNPEEALAEFNRAPQRPHMVVTDYCMEPMNGIELLQRCRASQPGLKSIMISGMVDASDFQTLPEKTDRFITKPFKVSNLIQTLHDTLAKAHN
jgi:CheY-like chemotaxis protein